MEIIRNQKVLQDYIERQKEMGKRIGFAPTMGALHDGHLSLYREARKHNDLVLSSIFVNPTQFNNTEDLEKYPRNIEKDIEILKNSKLVDAVYIPAVEDIYPEKIDRKTYDFGGIEKEMEGKSRPGHFDGVGTVVEILFRQVKPDYTYFGEKDFQQLAIIKKMAHIQNLPVKIVGVPTARAENGLALSSRNQRLTENRRESSKIIFQTLQNVKKWFTEDSYETIKKRVNDLFDAQQGMKLEYFMIADEHTLREAEFFYKDKQYRAFIVVIVDDVRLIDNLPMY